MFETTEVVSGEEKAREALHQVRKFTTQIWEHPLLDDQTSEHRVNGILNFNKFIIENDLELKNYIAIPYGSVVWATDEKSDWDFSIVAINEKAKEDLEYKKNMVLSEGDKLSLNVFSLSNVMELRGDVWYRILLTPDDYIGGNVKFVQQLRNFIAQVSNNTFQKNVNVDYDKWFRLKFKEGYSHIRTTISFGNFEKRARRISNALGRRARQSRDNERYGIAFNKALDRFIPPKLSVYKTAMVYSNGKLSLDEKYYAKGIV